MPYPTSLDESTTKALLHELDRRVLVAEQGLCTYCEYSKFRIPCKLAERHISPDVELREIVDWIEKHAPRVSDYRSR